MTFLIPEPANLDRPPLLLLVKYSGEIAEGDGGSAPSATEEGAQP